MFYARFETNFNSKPFGPERITWCTAVPKLLVWTQRQGCHRSMVIWYVAVSHVYWTVPCHPYLKVMKEIDEALHQKVQTCLNLLILKHLTGRNHTWVEILCLYHEHQVQSSTYLESHIEAHEAETFRWRKEKFREWSVPWRNWIWIGGTALWKFVWIDFSPLPRHGLQARDLEGACLDVFLQLAWDTPV